MLESLRIALIIPNKTPAWILKTIENIQAIHGVEISLLIFADAQPATDAWASHLTLEKKLFRLEPDPWVESANPLQETPSMQFTETDSLKRLPAFKLDVIINLALIEYPNILLENSRFGVWTLHDGQTRFVHLSPIGWRELFNEQNISTCAVEMLRHNQPAQITSPAILATDMQSIARNQLRLLWKGASRLQYTLKKLMRLGQNEFFADAESTEIKFPQPPANAQLHSFQPKQLLAKASEKFRKSTTRDQWGLLLKNKTAHIAWDGLQRITPPLDRLWADPFIMEREGKPHIFVEEMFYKQKRGQIACLSLDENGNILNNQTVLERPYHLSYPFLFEHHGEFYMLPETRGNNTIEVYRCARFPDQWEFHKTLMRNIHAMDTTLIEHTGRWWMFTTIVEHGHSSWDALHLFYADDPLSDSWTAHPLNPVISDVRSARMAGRLFRLNGNLIRPAQDSSRRYGYAINFNKITTLTSIDYAETRIERLEPQDDILASHTFNFSQNWTVMDMTVRRKK